MPTPISVQVATTLRPGDMIYFDRGMHEQELPTVKPASGWYQIQAGPIYNGYDFEHSNPLFRFREGGLSDWSYEWFSQFRRVASTG